MGKGKIAKASKRRLLIFGFLSFVIIGYFCVSIFTYAYKLVNLYNENEKLSNDLTTLKTNEQNLKSEVEKLKDPNYIAKYAREHYLYTKDGEYVIKIEPNNKEEKKENKKYNLNGYIVIPTVTVLSFIFIYIIKRK